MNPVEFSDDQPRLDYGRKVLRIGTRTVPLTPMEMRFLTVLVEASGKVVSVEDLLVQVWDAVDVSHRPTTPLKSLVQRLRKKIEPDPQHPRFLLTVRGFGYLIEGIRREDTVSSSADDHRVSD